MKTEFVNKTNRVFSFFVFSVVLILGIVFLVLATKIAGQTVPENYVEIDAKITEIEEIKHEVIISDSENVTDEYEYHVYVEYSYGGQTFSDVEYDSYDSSMKEGGTVKLYVNPDDPAEWMGDPSGNFIFVIISVVVILIGVAGIGYNIYKKKRSEA